MKRVIVLSAFAVVLFTSCSPKAVPVAETSVITEEMLAQGKTIYENSCGKCHDLYDPTKFTSVEWVGIMNAMAPKAKLTDEQHQLVYDYVVSVKK
ncbi:MAG: cytochrome C [Bergeyella sp.]